MDDKSHGKIELIILLLLISSGIVGGIWAKLIGEIGLSSILFSISLATILYRFLGGISQDSSFKMGVVKLSGSAAVLIGFMWVMNSNILSEKETVKVDPTSGWIAINSETGEGMDVKIGDFVQVAYSVAERKRRKNTQLNLLPGEGRYHVTANYGKDTIGVIREIKQLQHKEHGYMTLEIDNTYDFSLQPFRANQSSRNNALLPENLFFEVKVVNCMCEIVSDEQVIWSKSMSKGGGHMKFLEHPITHTPYMLYLLGADCSTSDDPEMDASFLLLEFKGN